MDARSGYGIPHDSRGCADKFLDISARLFAAVNIRALSRWVSQLFYGSGGYGGPR
jgi:hypothetical protein